jgi:uncharacterized caspase-like protein
MWLRCLLLLVSVLGVSFGSLAPQAAGERRIALIIGNAGYDFATRLANPHNDARAIAEVLQSIGFDQVELEIDLDDKGLRKALKQFGVQADSAATAVIYFAGHGVEVDGVNYLVPTDAALANAGDVEFEAVPLDIVRSAVAGASSFRLIVLDACRNNPFKLASASRSRSVGRGLARVDAGPDELIAYAAREGTVASDGTGQANSPFAAALVRHLAEPDLDVRLMFGRVRDDVLSLTSNQQEPTTYGSLGGQEVYLNRQAAPSSTPVAPGGLSSTPGVASEEDEPQAGTGTPEPSEEKEAWLAVKDVESCAMLSTFAESYPAGFYAKLAKARLDELRCGERAISVEPTTPPAQPQVPDAFVPVGPPAFDCATDRNPDEQTICGDAELSSLDRDLNGLYQQVRWQAEQGGWLAALRSEQRSWLSQRRACGWSSDCIRALYTARIEELRGYASGQ